MAWQQEYTECHLDLVLEPGSSKSSATRSRWTSSRISEASARVSMRGVIGVKRLKTSLRTPLRPPGRQNQSVRCAVVFAQTRTCKIRLTRWSALVMLPELTLKRPMHHAKGECANNDIQLVPLVVLTRKRKRKAAGEIAEKKKD
jgi:hypothetical protein